MLNLKHLYYFHIFAQELSTTTAAKRLGVSSPTLSNQLKELEEFLGVKLTVRTSGKLVVTESGQMVCHYADRMFSAYDELQARLSIATDSKGSRFRAGVCHNVGAQFSFDLLSLIVNSSFSLSQKAQITFDSSESLIEGFRKDQFDLILGAFPSEIRDESSWISQTMMFPVRLFAPQDLMTGIEPKNRQFAQTDLTKVIELANAKRISLVLPSYPSVLRDETERFLLNSKVLTERTIECNSSAAIVQLIERGFAMGFVPTPCLLDFRVGDILSMLGPPGGYWNYCVSVLIKKGSGKTMTQISPLARMFSPK
jgi:DNA-binding transcriptional LysR family regulator